MRARFLYSSAISLARPAVSLRDRRGRVASPNENCAGPGSGSLRDPQRESGGIVDVDVAMVVVTSAASAVGHFGAVVRPTASRRICSASPEVTPPLPL